jgi:hypothetical protein
MSEPRKKPEAIDLDNPRHRVAVLRAKHALMSHGGVDGDHHPECMIDERAASAKAAGYALRNWNDLAGP